MDFSHAGLKWGWSSSVENTEIDLNPPKVFMYNLNLLRMSIQL